MSDEGGMFLTPLANLFSNIEEKLGVDEVRGRVDCVNQRQDEIKPLSSIIQNVQPDCLHTPRELSTIGTK